MNTKTAITFLVAILAIGGGALLWQEYNEAFQEHPLTWPKNPFLRR